MNKNKFVALAILPILALVTGCNEAGAASGSNEPLPTFAKSHLEDLQKGVTLNATLTETFKFYDDPEYLESSKLIEDKDRVLKIDLTFTNTDSYTGVDVKVNQLLKNNETAYIMSENSYKDDDHLKFNVIGYDNLISSDSAALDNYDNPVSYGSNAAMNPFTLLKYKDFKRKDGKDDVYQLDKVKSSLLFNNITFYNSDIPLNTTILDNSLKFENNILKEISLTTNEYKDRITVDYENVYCLRQSSVTVDVTEIGKADAKSKIVPEPEKAENNDLGEALRKLSEAQSYRIKRHYKTDAADDQQTIELYYSKEDKAIYQAVYDSFLGGAPEDATTADGLYIDSSKDDDKLLNAYMLQPLRDNPTKFAFQPSRNLISINNVFNYEDLLLNVVDVNQNVFNKNEDGSYSPIKENLAYMAGDCFVPPLCTTEEIAGAYVDGFKLYLTPEKTLDKIVLHTTYGGYHAEITLTYSEFDTATIPFDALNRIVED